MKRAAAAAIFLLLMLFCCGLCLWQLGAGVRKVRASINEAYLAVERENNIPDAILRIEASWQEHHPLFRLIFGSDNCFNFETTLASAKARSMEKIKSPELFSELSSLDSCIEQLWQTQLPAFENLF